MKKTKTRSENIVDALFRATNTGYESVGWTGMTSEENNLLCYLAEKLNIDLDFHEHSPICSLKRKE